MDWKSFTSNKENLKKTSGETFQYDWCWDSKDEKGKRCSTAQKNENPIVLPKPLQYYNKAS